MVVIIGLEGSANKIGIGIIRDGEVGHHFLALRWGRWGGGAFRNFPFFPHSYKILTVSIAFITANSVCNFFQYI